MMYTTRSYTIGIPGIEYEGRAHLKTRKFSGQLEVQVSVISNDINIIHACNLYCDLCPFQKQILTIQTGKSTPHFIVSGILHRGNSAGVYVENLLHQWV